MCEIVFRLLVEFYYQLSLILEQKYLDIDKSIMRGKFFIAINDNKKLITIKYRDNASTASRPYGTPLVDLKHMLEGDVPQD